ncbi:MAG TPA: AAA family ATPase [Elusimicrobia bacterium]|nr:AAA family ATPase [Elusimicrobiota bacterium]HBT62177.1 AAA family ATPase [Elusimicrobiota bacterium]
MTFKRQTILSPLQENLARPAHVLQILVGPRQVGKTTAIHQFLENWPEPKVYATADQLTPPNTQWLAETWRQARKQTGGMPLLVIDEIQKVSRWSEAVKMLHDEDVRERRRLRVILLGSSALLLQHGMRESLAGRFQLIECPHWSYSECRGAFGWELDQFLFYGGYPGAVPFIDDFNAWKDYVQNSLLETVIGRDIPAVQRIDHPALFRQTLGLACQHPAQVISLQKMMGQLQDRGSINTLANYLELIAGAFLVEPVRKFSSRAIRVRTSSPKLIARNNALVTALRGLPFAETVKDRDFYGRLVENAVGAALINAGESVFYWCDRNKEVDFIVQRGKTILAIEITAGAGHRTPGLGTFLHRYPEAKAVRIGGARADLSVAQFFDHGI